MPRIPQRSDEITQGGLQTCSSGAPPTLRLRATAWRFNDEPIFHALYHHDEQHTAFIPPAKPANFPAVNLIAKLDRPETARPELPHLVPPPKYVTFSIGPHRYKIEINAKITPVPDRPAHVIPIDRERRRTGP